MAIIPRTGLILSSLLEAALDLIYPSASVCPLCGDEPITSTGTCLHCWESLRREMVNLCRRCGRPADLKDGLCVECARGEHCFTSAQAAGLYHGQLRRRILQLKFWGRADLADAFGSMIAQVSRQQATWRVRGVDGVTWVPMHPDRERSRGYNQARLIARRVSHEMDVPLMGGILVRTFNTPPQTSLGGAERRRNLNGAIKVWEPSAVRGKRVLLVDDVMTTGATLDACSTALYAAGAREVHALVVATSRVGDPEETPCSTLRQM